MTDADPITRLNAALEGRYRIESEVGEGGMATVYLAEDLRHHRNVALKVLKPELAAVVGSERFLAEIETTAGLQHPHILPLFDSGEADGFLFYVMPYVEGESLRERLDRDNQLPVGEALEITSKIASALDHAHRHGVVHRDIKPANILLQDGEPIVADFGIAIALSAAGGSRLTETGLSVGMPHYMSPEQAAGDRRVGPPSDIYSLACVLYEMLVGEPPYQASTPQAVIGKILRGELQPAAATRSTIPPNVDAAITKALERYPADRFSNGAGFAEALSDSSFRYGREAAAERTRSGRAWKLAAVFGWTFAAIAVALIVWVRPFGASGEGEALRFTLELPEGITLEPSDLPSVSVSSDGRRLVFTGIASGAERQLFRRELSSFQVEPISGTAGAMGPFFSPDGTWIGFFADGKLKKVPFAGGLPVVLADAPLARGATWAADGTILFTAAPGSGLWRVSAAGGTAELATHLAEDERTHRLPDMAKGGDVVVFTARSGSHPRFDDATIDRVSLADGARETLLVGGSDAQLLPSGVLVFFRGGDLRAVKVDAETLRPIGETVSVLEGVMSDPSTGAAQYSISETGLLVYVEGDEWLPRRLLTVADRAGTSELLPTEGRPFRSPRLSPDESRLAVVIEAANDDIWTYTLSDMAAQRLTFASGSNVAPVWSPDGSRIAFASNRFGVYNLFVKAADLSGQAIRLTTNEEIQFPSSWHPDGSVIAFTQNSSGTANGIWMVPTDGGDTRAFLDAPHNEYGGVFSPDGQWIAYVSDEGGEDQIFVQRYPDRGSKRQISIDGGTHPHWSEDGGRLFYWSDRGVMAVRIDGGSDFRPGTPELAFRWPDNATTGIAAVPNFDLGPSGSFLIVEEAQIQAPRRIHAVRGWMQEVQAIVGR